MSKFQHFFETINPLNGFDGKESLETYMWEQSLKVEPKDPDKMEFVVSFLILFYVTSITVRCSQIRLRRHFQDIDTV